MLLADRASECCAVTCSYLLKRAASLCDALPCLCSRALSCHGLLHAPVAARCRDVLRRAARHDLWLTAMLRREALHCAVVGRHAPARYVTEAASAKRPPTLRDVAICPDVLRSVPRRRVALCSMVGVSLPCSDAMRHMVLCGRLPSAATCGHELWAAEGHYALQPFGL